MLHLPTGSSVPTQHSSKFTSDLTPWVRHSCASVLVSLHLRLVLSPYVSVSLLTRCMNFFTVFVRRVHTNCVSPIQRMGHIPFSEFGVSVRGVRYHFLFSATLWLTIWDSHCVTWCRSWSADVGNVDSACERESALVYASIWVHVCMMHLLL